jgi:hypothetical protein
MFEFEDAASFVMRAQISRETGSSYQKLQYRSGPTLIHFGVWSGDHAEILSFGSDCLPFGAPVLVLAR